MAWNGFPGSSTMATACAAGCLHSFAMIRAGDAPQETADQASDNQMIAVTGHLSWLLISTADAAIRVSMTA
jgi:hypothetical protein